MSAAMKSWHGDLSRWGVPSDIAQLISMDCAVFYGRARVGGEEKATVGKAGKDGTASFKISGKTGNVQFHNSMAIVRIVQRMEDLRASLLREGLLQFNAGDFRPADWLEYLGKENGVEKYYASVADRAKDVQWFDTKEEYDEHIAAEKAKADKAEPVKA